MSQGTKKPVKIDARAEKRAQTALEQRTRTRAAILDAAFQVIGHENGRLARIEDVARVSGIARPTIYTYFSSMEELLAALSYDLSLDFDFKVLSYGSTLKTATEETSAAIRYHLGRARTDARWGWGMVNMSVGGPIFGAEIHAACTATIQWGIDSGEFKPASAEIGRDMVLGTGLAAMKTILTAAHPEAYPELVARQVLVGLGVTAARADKVVAKPLPPVLAGPKAAQVPD